MVNGQRFNKRNVTDMIMQRIYDLMEKYDLPHPSSNGWDQINRIKKQKYRDHTPEMRIMIWGEMSALYELVDDIHWN